MSTSPGSTPSVTYIHTQEFLPAAIKTLFTDSPITLVTAPGSGKFILPISIVLDYKAGAAPFFSASGAGTIISLLYGAAGTVIPFSFLTSTAVSTNATLVVVDSNVASSGSPLNASTSQVVVYDFVPFGTSVLTSGSMARSTMENKALVLNVANANPTNGHVVTTSINAAGTGYAPGDTLADDGVWGNSDLLVTVNTVGGGGNVLTYTVTNVGTSGWHINPPADTSSVITFSNVPPQSGSGSGFALNVTSIAQGDGTLRLTVQYQVLTLG